MTTISEPTDYPYGERQYSARDFAGYVWTFSPLEERLTLVEEIWGSIAADAGVLPLTEVQRRELEKRIAEDDMHPDDVTPREQVKASTLARLAK